MRLSRLISVTFVVGVAAAATIIACGGDSKTTPDSKVFMDAKMFMDAPVGGSANGLGQLCPFGSGGAGSACITGDACVSITGLGSATTGYCTPNCMGSNAVCINGYSGPAGGMPACALSVGSGSAATGCAIICTAVAQCPTGMNCVTASGSTKICVPN